VLIFSSSRISWKKMVHISFQVALVTAPQTPPKPNAYFFPCAFLACGNGYFLIYLTMCLKQYNADLQTPEVLSHSLPLLLPLLPKKKICHADQLVLMTPSHIILGSGPIWY
jgi:hypothetical protein